MCMNICVKKIVLGLSRICRRTHFQFPLLLVHKENWIWFCYWWRIIHANVLVCYMAQRRLDIANQSRKFCVALIEILKSFRLIKLKRSLEGAIHFTDGSARQINWRVELKRRKGSHFFSGLNVKIEGFKKVMEKRLDFVGMRNSEEVWFI